MGLQGRAHRCIYKATCVYACYSVTPTVLPHVSRARHVHPPNFKGSALNIGVTKKIGRSPIFSLSGSVLA